jgi:hypothetical protein
LKKTKHTINVLIWALASLFLAMGVLIHIPAVQSKIGSTVASVLSDKLGTKVQVGRVDLGFLNRIIIDDVRIEDQRGQMMLRSARISAKLDYMALAKGEITINSAQLFSLKANLYKITAKSKPNFQFVLDSLASKDTTRQKTPLNLAIQSLIIRHGDISYNQLDLPRLAKFTPAHIHVSNLSSHIMLNKLSDDSLNLNVRKLSLSEASGLHINALQFKLVANRRRASLQGFHLVLPHTSLTLGDIAASYSFIDKKLELSSLQYEGSILESVVTPADLSAFVPTLKNYDRPVVLAAQFNSGAAGLRVSRLEAALPQKGLPVTLASASDAHLLADGSFNYLEKVPRWAAYITDLTVNAAGLQLFANKIPAMVVRLGNISYKGSMGGYGTDMGTRGQLRSGAGDARVELARRGDSFSAKVETEGFNLRQLLGDETFGTLATNISLKGNIRQKNYVALGQVKRFDYKGYSYRNIAVDGSASNGIFDGKVAIDDPNVAVDIAGTFNSHARQPVVNLTADIKHFAPAPLRLMTGKLADATYSARIKADFKGRDLNTADGMLSISHFTMTRSSDSYVLDSLQLKAGNNAQGHYLNLDSDFASAKLSGHYDYSTLLQSLANVLVKKLPSLQQLTSLRYRPVKGNDFALKANITRSDCLRQFFGMKVELLEPMRLEGSMSNLTGQLSINAIVPDVVYNDAHYRYVSVVVNASTAQLDADISATKLGKNGVGADYRVEAEARDDQLVSVLTLDNHAATQRATGRLNTVTRFGLNAAGQAEARLYIDQSELAIGDTVFTIHPSSVVYSKNHLDINGFALTHERQHLLINGTAAKGTNDSLTIDLNGINVSYVLDLVNFHSVDFSGYASGKAHVSRLFDHPEARASLTVDEFKMMNGRLGTLYADVKWNQEEGQIDIDASALDTMRLAQGPPAVRRTLVQGYVSPKRNYIDLDIKANKTRAEFLEWLCSSFMSNTDLMADGDLKLSGDLKQLNLTGSLVANGSATITPLNTRYTLHNDTIRFLVNEIVFANDTIYDRNGNVGIVDGSLYHQHLSRMSYDLGIRADHFLGYDWSGADGSTFYGTVYGTGHVDIKGKSGQVNIDVNVTPTKGSQLVYDISSPDEVSSQEFIQWVSRDSLQVHSPSGRGTADNSTEKMNIPTDIHIYFLLNTGPDATMKLIMDKASGDYITLNGSGGLRATYYNKGGLDIFGTYTVDHGLYKLTIQNVIKKDFEFMQGGTVVFGGDPYNATLNLNAQYTVNSVSLSDLQIGRSFSGNNIRVNCLMNITGTPNAPKVDFNLDMPTIGNDAKQMIYSLINSEEEMNQQVLYLLAVGRFYAQGSNNASTGSSDSQTSLALQSLLSGQISQQINSVINSVVNNTNWNFGANISTGDEGWNNAEYEGLLSGRLLNNRLLIDGQFGYRDKANATTSFIGDFDVKYLVTPNGNISLHVYNQTDDRYFTRNSLNTQGFGFILKKDFTSLRDLLGLKPKKVKVENQNK